MWSIGVIAFVMLSGRPPFNGRYVWEQKVREYFSLAHFASCLAHRNSNDEAIFRKIKRGGYKMNSLWDGISDNAKDFVRCLLVRDPQQRWTADMALQHPWLR